MSTLNEIKKYLNYEFSSGPYTGEDYKSFQRKYINYLRAIAKSNNWELVNIIKGHYQFSAFFKANNQYIYISISDVRFFPNEWYKKILYRTATSEKDYHGGCNHLTNLEQLPTALAYMFNGGLFYVS